MPNIEFEGLVTRQVKYGENSRILTVLAKDTGKVSIMAGRARSTRSGMLNSTQLFAYSDFTVFKGRDNALLKINEGEVINSFSGIRSSLEGMAYASYFCDIINRVCQEGEAENNILRLVLNSLYMLEKNKNMPRTEAVFLFRILAEAGFAPDCGGCAKCGSGKNIRYMLPTDGVFICGGCGAERGLEINDTLYFAIKYIINSSLSEAFSFTLGEKSMEYLCTLGEEYMSVCLEADLKTLSYLRSVRGLTQ